VAPVSRRACKPTLLRGWALLGGFLALAAAQVHAADAGWFEAGDTQLRLDLQLLNDAEVIVLPLNQWPLPRAAVQYALKNAKDHFATNSAVMVALERVRARAATPAQGQLSYDTGVRGGEPGLWRDFDTIAREDGELGAGLTYDSGRFSAGLEVTAVPDPSDGDELRLDGSHATVQWGNWLVSANELDRWWGPGHESSLILSNNARPMPTLMVERAEARPFGPKWLSWLGPYRFSFGISQMESDRADIDAPLFMAWRVVVMPFKKIELGFSRTAQFCGEQLSCDLNTFGNMLAGNDNVGIDATEENEPGNQMAGFDIRWNSPIGNLPYAIYSQFIGEDESSYLPVKFLEQFGVEIWKAFPEGGVAQLFAEYADTTCSAARSTPRFNCAYNQGRFNVEGYRYRGRVVGHTADRDAETYALGAVYVEPNGTLWRATLRRADLNRDDSSDPNNTVSGGPADYAAFEVGWRGRLWGGALSVDLGVESFEPAGADAEVDPFGFVGWRREFAP
jgi:hypothetical protein